MGQKHLEPASLVLLCVVSHLHVHAAAPSVCVSPAGTRAPSSSQPGGLTGGTSLPRATAGACVATAPAALLHLPRVSAAPVSAGRRSSRPASPALCCDREQPVATAGSSTFTPAHGSWGCCSCSAWVTVPAGQLSGLSCPLQVGNVG